MLYAKITGIASYVPDDILDNEQLSQMVDTTDEWITTRVGIKERRILKQNVGSSFLGIKAVNKLLERTGTKPEEVDLLICPTSNPDYRFPSTASIIAHNCGMDITCYAYDIQGACAGFLVGLYSANAYVKAGLYKKVIVVSAEKMSSMTDYQDRATCPLFGDGCLNPLKTPTRLSSTACSTSTATVSNTSFTKQVVRPSPPASRPSNRACTSSIKKDALCTSTR